MKSIIIIPVYKDYFIDGEYLILKYNQRYFGKESSLGIFDMPLYITADGSEVKEASDDIFQRLYSKYADSNEIVRIFKIGGARKLMVGTYDGSDVKILKDKSFVVITKK